MDGLVQILQLIAQGHCQSLLPADTTERQYAQLQTASVDLLSMPPMTLQVSNSGRLLHNGAQADAQAGLTSRQTLTLTLKPNPRTSKLLASIQKHI